jgi:hypothetical protein
MIRIGQRQFEVPLWLWVAVPLAWAMYAAYGATIYLRIASHSDGYFLLSMKLCAGGALAGFILSDLARRSILPWYDLIVLALASFAASSLAIDGLVIVVEETPSIIAGLAMRAAISIGAGYDGARLLFAASTVVLLGCGLILALLLTIASRYVLGLPLWAADTRREFRASLVGAYVWLAIAFGGYLVIRSAYQLPLGHPAVPRWLPVAAACLSAIAALAVQLSLAYRVRRTEFHPRHSLKVGALAAACAFAWFYSPDIFGQTGFWVMNNQVRPALRTLHVLPTPVIAVAGYRVDVPYQDVKVFIGPAMPDGATSFVVVPLPDEYGLTSTSRNPQVHIARRDITLREMTRFFWFDSRKELGEMQATRRGEDAVVRVPLGVMDGLAFRSDEYPLVDVRLIGFDKATPTEVAEQALRRFLRERLQRVSG